jgi:hypothetical protein
MNQRFTNLLITGIVVVAIGVNMVIFGVNDHHRALEVAGWVAEIIGVFCLGVAAGHKKDS